MIVNLWGEWLQLKSVECTNTCARLVISLAIQCTLFVVHFIKNGKNKKIF